MTVAPTALGGPATFVLVDGNSMEPMLHSGDLVVAHRQSAYAIGDLVIMHVDPDQGVRTSVIHRIVSGSAAEGWRTKGDNNSWVDPWLTADGAVAGRFWISAPGVGNALVWVNAHTWLFACVCSLFALLLYLPWRRMKFTPVLLDSLATAEKEPRRDGRSNQEYGVLAVSGLAMAAALALIGLLGMSHNLRTLQGLVAGIALLWSGGFTVYFVYRLYDGRGVKEPARSMYALSGRLHLVSELPTLDSEVREVRSAVALRTIAEKYRMPVLHRIDSDSRLHEFLLITVQEGAFVWRPVLEPSASMSDGDFYGGARTLLLPAGRHVRPSDGHVVALEANPPSVAVIGREPADVNVGSAPGCAVTRVVAIASAVGLLAGGPPVGSHQLQVRAGRGRRIGRWATAASAVTLVAAATPWIAANPHLAILGTGALAALVAGRLVWRYAEDDTIHRVRAAGRATSQFSSDVLPGV